MRDVKVTIGHLRVVIFNDEPTSAFPIDSWIVSTGVPPEGVGGEVSTTRAAVEFFQPLGGRNSRALLGGSATASQLPTVQVGRSSDKPVIERWCISRLGRDLTPGLPDPFARSVFQSLAGGLATEQVPQTIMIDRAGYDDVDSSERAFEQAARLLAALLHAAATGDDLVISAGGIVRSWNDRFVGAKG